MCIIPLSWIFCFFCIDWFISTQVKEQRCLEKISRYEIQTNVSILWRITCYKFLLAFFVIFSKVIVHLFIIFWKKNCAWLLCFCFQFPQVKHFFPFFLHYWRKKEVNLSVFVYWPKLISVQIITLTSLGRVSIYMTYSCFSLFMDLFSILSTAQWSTEYTTFTVR